MLCCISSSICAFCSKSSLTIFYLSRGSILLVESPFSTGTAFIITISEGFFLRETPLCKSFSCYVGVRWINLTSFLILKSLLEALDLPPPSCDKLKEFLERTRGLDSALDLLSPFPFASLDFWESSILFFATYLSTWSVSDCLPFGTVLGTGFYISGLKTFSVCSECFSFIW